MWKGIIRSEALKPHYPCHGFAPLPSLKKPLIKIYLATWGVLRCNVWSGPLVHCFLSLSSGSTHLGSTHHTLGDSACFGQMAPSFSSQSPSTLQEKGYATESPSQLQNPSWKEVVKKERIFRKYLWNWQDFSPVLKPTTGDLLCPLWFLPPLCGTFWSGLPGYRTIPGIVQMEA